LFDFSIAFLIKRNVSYPSILYSFANNNRS
jgi:hypothetical protein